MSKRCKWQDGDSSLGQLALVGREYRLTGTRLHDDKVAKQLGFHPIGEGNTKQLRSTLASRFRLLFLGMRLTSDLVETSLSATAPSGSL